MKVIEYTGNSHADTEKGYWVTVFTARLRRYKKLRINSILTQLQFVTGVYDNSYYSISSRMARMQLLVMVLAAVLAQGQQGNMTLYFNHCRGRYHVGTIYSPVCYFQ